MKMTELEQQAAAAWEALRGHRRMITQIAEALGIAPQAVWVWPVVPLHRMHDVARITGMRWQDLRPDAAAMPPGVVEYLIERARQGLAKVTKTRGRRRNGRGRTKHKGRRPATHGQAKGGGKRTHAKLPHKRKIKSALKNKPATLSTPRAATGASD
jgi:hypothetical protein